MPVTSQMKVIGDELISWWSPQVAGLSLVSFDWTDQMRAQPAYPCDPRTECPRAFLRMFQQEFTYSTNLGCDETIFRYAVSLWLQLRQTPGQDHQELLVTALDTFVQPLITADYDLSSAGLSVTGLVDLRVPSEDSVRVVVYDELEHPLRDPELRVSTGEVNFTLFGRLRA